jgi:hypothetical protein
MSSSSRNLTETQGLYIQLYLIAEAKQLRRRRQDKGHAADFRRVLSKF